MATPEPAVIHSETIEGQLTSIIVMDDEAQTSTRGKRSQRVVDIPLFKSWILPDKSDTGKVKCKYCVGKSYTANKIVLERHMKTKKHKKNFKKSLPKKRKPTCRTCLAKCIPKDMISVFDVDWNSNCTYNYMMLSVTGIEASESDKLPTCVCRDCKQSLVKAYNFQVQAKKSHAVLRDKSSDDESSGYEDSEANTDISDDEPSNNSDSEGDTFDDKGKRNVKFASHYCSKCSSTFSTAKLLSSHDSYCRGEPVEGKSNQCRVCSKSFDNALVLVSHVQKAHPNIVSGKDKADSKPNQSLLKKKAKTIISKNTGSRANGIRHCHIPIIGVLKPLEKWSAKVNAGGNAKANAGGNAKGNADSELPEADAGQEKSRCGVCSDLFSTASELEEHCRKHAETEVIMCALCERVYLKYSQFKRHFTVHHPDMELINQTENTETIVEIKDTAAMEQVLQSVRMTSIGDLITANILPSDVPTVIEAYVQVCGLCGCIILSREDLKLHNQTEHPDFIQRCYYCGKKFTEIISLMQHKNRCKRVESKQECLACGQRFYKPVSLDRHVASDHPRLLPQWKQKRKRESRYVCEICGRSFQQQRLLNLHVQSCEPEGIMECDHCPKTFKKKFYLMRHLKYMHSPDGVQRTHLCSVCGKAFSVSHQLIVHMRTHTRDFPYKCTFCEKTFATAHAFKYHQRSHTGDTPLVCNICGRGFCRPVSLRQHMMIHTGERPHRCTECDASFIQPHGLTVHMRKRHAPQCLTLDPKPFKKPYVWLSAEDELKEEPVEEKTITPTVDASETEVTTVYRSHKRTKTTVQGRSLSCID